jgi:L-ascorbate metabolism protein UlaG (beta-lactamase superfamily)
MKQSKSRKKRRTMWIIISIISILALSFIVFINLPRFGKVPGKERLERVRNSENYRDGKFQNVHETKQLTSVKSYVATLWGFLFKKKERLNPQSDLPVVKTNLWELNRDEDLLVWFGHSSYMIQTDGKRILVDPVLCGAASPVSFVNKPFKGTDVYRPEDIPEIDYLVISHDHWDHLDYKTVMSLKDRVGKIVCGLGVGEHFEYWGFQKNDIIELDWNESLVSDGIFTIYCLPARHFSGRGLSPNQSLWASFLIESPSRKIYIGGDGGFDTHYAEIGERFDEIDLAVLENGQYDTDWRYIHMLPEQPCSGFCRSEGKKTFYRTSFKICIG